MQIYRGMWIKLIPIFLLLSFSAWSAVIDLSSPALYDPEGNKELYTQAVSDIKPGDILLFPDGAKFTIESKLGQGTYAYIFSIQERPDQILRIANAFDGLKPLQFTLKGYEELKDSGIRLVKLDPQSNSHYVLAEKIQPDYLTIAEMVLGTDFGTDKFFYDPSQAFDPYSQICNSTKCKKLPKLDPTFREEMKQAFWTFVRSTAPYVRIADLHEANVVYDRHSKQWVLIDWGEGHKLIDSQEDLEILPRVVDLMFSHLRANGSFGFKYSDEAKIEIEIIRAQTEAILIEEKNKYLKTHGSDAAEISCKSLIGGRP